MWFNAKEIAKDRFGTAFREPKKGEKPPVDSVTGQIKPFEDSQLRDCTFGDLIIMALDGGIPEDEKLCKDNPSKWVIEIVRRERISSKIAKALTEDGCVELEEAEMIIDRLAQFVPAVGLARVGPVIAALKNPPERKPKVVNGKGLENGLGETVSA